nr:MAG TPA: hypothetical protein [Caudoviricetes sp.]DAK63621.1 MAG TPA: hypothetical protein [Caudoviricetes sp.]DAS89080.1 MAG TPA: hypothetical protein [Caudoviricetes sp.]
MSRIRLFFYVQNSSFWYCRRKRTRLIAADYTAYKKCNQERCSV